MKRFTALLLSVVLLCGLMPAASAAKIVEKGSLGKNVTYTLDDKGVLTFSGTGEMGATGACDYKFALKKIDKVVIEEGITSVGDYVFRQCEAKEFAIPSTVQKLGNGSFYYCMNVKEFKLPEGITEIPHHCFFRCDGMKGFRAPASVKVIGYEAFACCDRLETINISAGVTTISGGAFASCPKLKSITVDPDNPYYASEGGVLFSADKKTLYQYPAGKTAKSYTVPDGVERLNSEALRKCESLEKVTLPDSLLIIGTEAFTECRKLKQVNLPEGLQRISPRAFKITSLKQIRIPASVFEIDSGVFAGCSYLKEIRVDPESESFKFEGGMLMDMAGTRVIAVPKAAGQTSFKVPDGVKRIDNYAFSGTNTEKVTLPDSVTLIGECAFSGTKLTGISLPGKLETIQDSAFAGCNELKSVKIPDSVTYLGTFAFSDCKGLQTAVLPRNLEEIRWGVFYRCYALREVTLPKKVRKITENAFVLCSALRQVNYPGSETERKKITIEDDNEFLERANWTYNFDGGGTLLDSFKLNKTRATLKKGKSLQLKVLNIKPAEAKDVKFRWTSSDKKVAVVLKNGRVKAKGKGTCVITCEAQDGSGLKKTCKITVK